MAEPGQIGFTLSFDLDSAPGFNTDAGRTSDGPATVRMTGSIETASRTRLVIDSLNIHHGSSDLTARANLDLARARPLLSAQFETSYLDLTPLLVNSPDKQGGTGERLFSDAPLLPDWLPQLDADIRFAARRLGTPLGDFTDVTLPLTLRAGVLTSESFSAALAGGQLSGRVQINDVTPRPRTDLKLRIRGLELGKLRHTDPDWISAGPLDLDLNGSATGQSPADLLAHANGQLRARVGAAVIPAVPLNLPIAGPFVTIIDRLNPLAAERKSSALECAVVDMSVSHGIAETSGDGIRMILPELSIRGGGRIDLVQETLDITLQSVPRQALQINPVDAAARISGTVARPVLAFGPIDALRNGVAAGTALITSPLALLNRPLQALGPDSRSPCDELR